MYLKEQKSGHRRYDLTQLLGIKADISLTIGYARVSSHDQKQDLERQQQVLELFCSQHGWQFQIIDDLGSGLNYSKRGLTSLTRANYRQPS